MNLEIIITTVLAIVTATLPLVQKKIINKTNIPNLHLVLLALLAGLITAFVVYCVATLGLMDTLYLVVIYFIVYGFIEITKFLSSQKLK